MFDGLEQIYDRKSPPLKKVLKRKNTVQKGNDIPLPMSRRGKRLFNLTKNKEIQWFTVKLAQIANSFTNKIRADGLIQLRISVLNFLISKAFCS